MKKHVSHFHVPSRREFFKFSSLPLLAAVGGGSVLSGCGETTHTASDKNTTQAVPTEHHTHDIRIFQGRKFFENNEDFEILVEASERIFPEDELGAGAKKLGVGFFIDNELAGSYGICDKEYMMPPFYEGNALQGYQGALNRRDIFQGGVRALQEESLLLHQKGFVALSDEQKDAILESFENNTSTTKIEGIQTSVFFHDLRVMTLAGVYSDPIYGANVNMQGWRMKKFPGAQMVYSHYVHSDKLDEIEPVSLADMMH